MQLRPRISVLSLNYPPESTGIAPYAGGLAAGLSGAGYHTEVYVAHPHYPEWKVREGYGQWARVDNIDGVRVHRKLHYVPRSPRGVRRLLSELTFGARLVFSRWNRPQVVIAVSPSLFATALALLRGHLSRPKPRMIVWVQDIYTLGMTEIGEGSGVVRAITRWVESHTLRAADRIVVIHQRFADFVTRELGVASSQVVTIRNWTHLPESDPIDAAAARAEFGWPNNVALAVHTGSMGAKQDLGNVVNAARIADERGASVHFLLVGNGGEKNELVERARGIARITFVDHLGDEEYRLALAAADVLLVNEKPGVATMAVPSKLTSYFDAGRPVVAATDPAGITASEIAAADAGVIVRAGDPSALLDAVLAVHADAEAAARFGLNGKRYRAAVLDEQVAIEQWGCLIEGTIRAPKPRSDSPNHPICATPSRTENSRGRRPDDWGRPRRS